MNPQTFQTDALAWIGVLSVVLIAAAAAIGKVIGAIQATQQEIKERQNRQGQTQTALLLATPPVGASQTVNAPAAQTVTVSEQPSPSTSPVGRDTPTTPENGAGGASVAGSALSPANDTSPPASGAGTPTTSMPFDPANPDKSSGFTRDQLAPVITATDKSGPAAEPVYQAGEAS